MRREPREAGRRPGRRRRRPGCARPRRVPRRPRASAGRRRRAPPHGARPLRRTRLRGAVAPGWRRPRGRPPRRRRSLRRRLLGAERRDPVHRQRAPGGPESDHAAQRGRDADGARGVGAQGCGHRARGHGGGRPPEDPPARCPGAAGLSTPGVVTPHAISCVVALPRQAAPSSASRCHEPADRSGQRQRPPAVPLRVGTPATSMMSLTSSGMPARGPAPPAGRVMARWLKGLSSTAASRRTADQDSESWACVPAAVPPAAAAAPTGSSGHPPSPPGLLGRAADGVEGQHQPAPVDLARVLLRGVGRHERPLALTHAGRSPVGAARLGRPCPLRCAGAPRRRARAWGTCRRPALYDSA